MQRVVGVGSFHQVHGEHGRDGFVVPDCHRHDPLKERGLFFVCQSSGLACRRLSKKYSLVVESRGKGPFNDFVAYGSALRNVRFKNRRSSLAVVDGREFPEKKTQQISKQLLFFRTKQEPQMRDLPANVVGVLNAGVESQPRRRRMLMGSISGQKHTPFAVRLGNEALKVPVV